MMRFIVCSDLHCCQNPQDAYRFGIFPWLAAQAEQNQIDDIFILGDLTEKKDNHSAELVNRIVDLLAAMPQRVTILKGNHDYVNPEQPYFRFLNSVSNNLKFVSKPTITRKLGDCTILHIPHGYYDPELLLEHKTDVVMMHVTVRGAVDFTGRELNGLPFQHEAGPLILSGDVHRAQVVGNVEYIGVPYETRYGETSVRSAILFKDGERHDLKFPAPRKRTIRIHTIDDLKSVKAKHGDFVQMVIELAPDAVGDVHHTRAKIEELAEARGLVLDGVQIELQTQRSADPAAKLQQPADAFAAFCEAHQLSPFLVQTGRKCFSAKGA